MGAAIKADPFSRMGCGAVDKGTNQPNVFIDPKSSESFTPYYSNGQRDAYMQMQYLRAMHRFWRDGQNNPTSGLYHAPMVDMDRAYVWAWDARPFPIFPRASDTWSDGANHAKGHWITGRTAAWGLADTVRDICDRAGFADIDTSDLYGYVQGFHCGMGNSARADLQALMLAYGFDAFEKDGKLSLNRVVWVGLSCWILRKWRWKMPPMRLNICACPIANNHRGCG